MDKHNFVWACEKLFAGVALTRDVKTWGGKQVFLVKKRNENVDKKHPLYPYCKGDTIIDYQLMIAANGVASPYKITNDDLFAEDWRHV